MKLKIKRINTFSRVRILKRLLPLLLLIFGLSALSAEPMWSGNASVDGSEFVNFVEDYPLAGASSSFTRNTRVKVINPSNDKSVEITIVKRAPRPGVFLLLSEQAAAELDMPLDQVIPVQVQVLADEVSREYEEFNSRDPDINPAMSVPESGSAPEAESVEPPEEAAADEGAGLFPEELVPVPVPDDSLRVDRSAEPAPEIHEAVETADMILPAEIPDETLGGEESGAEDSIALAPPVEEPVLPEPSEEASPAVDLSMEEELNGDILPSGENVIYFLTPSDFRPPTGPATVREEKEEIVPVLVNREALEDYIVANLNNGSSYIQLGAYSSPESIYGEIEAIEARYPMVVWTEARGEGKVYKLLIGPLTPDETGVLSYRFRDSGYADLFLYRP